MNPKKDEIEHRIHQSIEVKRRILEDPLLLGQIQSATELVILAYRNGRKTLLAGNGGSAADAQHIAAEFVGRYGFDRPALPSIALTTDTSILTAVGNDYGYERIFSRQVEALGTEGDVFVGISTSGNSANILEALAACKEKGIRSIGLTGARGGGMADLCDICLRVPSEETARVQESHILIGHILCGLVEEELFGTARTGS
jgi:D-sedoheptulose 7-phosphate isomerase